MECPKCGHINPDTAMNCEKCRTNLAWARGMRVQVQKRRKPAFIEVYVSFVVIGIVGLISLIYGYIADTRNPFVACLLPLVGIPLLAVGLWPLLWPWSAYNVLRRSSTTAQARVLDRHTKTGSMGSYDGVCPDYPYTVYEVIVQFNAVRSGGAVEQVTLEAQVSEKLHDRLCPGTEVTVRYATEDPRTASLEGKAGS